MEIGVTCKMQRDSTVWMCVIKGMEMIYNVYNIAAKEQKEKEQREENKKWRSVRDNEMKEERRRKEEEKEGPRKVLWGAWTKSDNV